MAIYVEHTQHLAIVIFTRPDASSTYEYGYIIGELPPNYPVPALADTWMVIALSHVCPEDTYKYAWDDIWRERPKTGWLAY